MKIYIASSWRNQLAVELLTMELRRRGHEVVSFVEQALKDELVFDNDGWIDSEVGEGKFYFDTAGATESHLVIYIGPSGTDAWAELGVAWQSGTVIIGFRAKGERAGLMRHMVDSWHQNAESLFSAVDTVAEVIGLRPGRD